MACVWVGAPGAPERSYARRLPADRPTDLPRAAVYGDASGGIMQLAAFAFDYDGTLAHDGRVAPATLAALARLKAAGPRLLLISGRELPDLQRTFPQYALFDAIVADNGGLLFQPGLHEERLLGSAPPAALIRALQRQQVQPLSIGRSIIATCKPHEADVLAAIRECGL